MPDHLRMPAREREPHMLNAVPVGPPAVPTAGGHPLLHLTVRQGRAEALVRTSAAVCIQEAAAQDSTRASLPSSDEPPNAAISLNALDPTSRVTVAFLNVIVIRRQFAHGCTLHEITSPTFAYQALVEAIRPPYVPLPAITHMLQHSPTTPWSRAASPPAVEHADRSHIAVHLKKMRQFALQIAPARVPPET